MEAIKKEFMFPNNLFINASSIDAYLDWWRDLSWLNPNEKKAGYALFMLNLSRMGLNDQKTKKIILDSFGEVISPFWPNK
jgi:hypothetical protein